MQNIFIVSAAISGFLSVALGAFGAHALKDTLDSYGHSVYNKAILYQMFHTLALLGVALLQNHFKTLNLSPAGYAFIIGIILFSGSLYVLAISGIKILGAVTPFGGLAFLFGWGWLAWQFIRTNAV